MMYSRSSPSHRGTALPSSSMMTSTMTAMNKNKRLKRLASAAVLCVAASYMMGYDLHGYYGADEDDRENTFRRMTTEAADGLGDEVDPAATFAIDDASTTPEETAPLRPLQDVFTLKRPLRYWFGAGSYPRICARTKELAHVDHLGDEPLYVQENRQYAPVFNVSLDCRELTDDIGTRSDLYVGEGGLGVGNFVLNLYVTRQIVGAGHVDFQFSCIEGRKEYEKTHILPWLNGYWPARRDTEWPFDEPKLEEQILCSDDYYWTTRLDPMATEIQTDMRRMAVALVGARNDEERAYVTEEYSEPLFPGLEMDDVAIHLRCGDIFGSHGSPGHGMIKFDTYRKFISPEAKTIGIVTQPFDPERNRRQDKGNVEACRSAVEALTAVLQQDFPEATITVRNDESETLPLAYARLVMANQTFSGPSAFGAFPLIGTFGHGYYEQGSGNAVRAVLGQIKLPNLHDMRASMVMAPEVKAKGIEHALRTLMGRKSQ